MRQAGLFGLTEHLEWLSKNGDPPEVLEATVDFEFFRPGWSRGWAMTTAREASAVRPGLDVQGADPAVAAQPLGRADGVHDPALPQPADRDGR